MEFIFKKPLVTAIIVIVLALGIIFTVVVSTRLPRKKEPTDFVTAQLKDIAATVETKGKVIPPEEVKLVFLEQGRVDQIYVSEGDTVKEGDIISNLKNQYLLDWIEKAKQSVKEKIRDLDDGKGELERQKDKLASLIAGYDPEAFILQRQRISGSRISVEEAKERVVENVKEAFLESERAIKRTDSMFFDPWSKSPRLKFETSDPSLAAEATFSRVSTELMVDAWSFSIKNLTTKSDLTAYVGQAVKNTARAKSFIDKAKIAFEDLDDPSVLDVLIEIWEILLGRADVDLRRAVRSVVSAQQNLTISEQSLEEAERGLASLLAGPTGEKIEAQEEVVEEAEGEVARLNRILFRAIENLFDLENKLSGTILVAPIEGTVSKIYIEEGQSVLVYSLGAEITPTDQVGPQIEVSLKEEEIRKLDSDDKVSASRRAPSPSGLRPSPPLAGGEEIEVEILHINYGQNKLTLAPEDPTQVKVGERLNIEIELEKREDAVVIPQEAIAYKELGPAIVVLTSAGLEERYVKTGIKDKEGNIEITDGLEEGERVAIF